jgi:sugar phosphate isomerase/epimerase
VKFAVCNEIFESADLTEAYKFTCELGYTGLEVAPFTLGESPTKLTSSERTAFSKKARDSGLEVIGLHWLLVKTEGFHLTTNDTAVRKRTADYFRELIELCSDLGGSIMVLGSPKQRNFIAPMTHSSAMGNAADLISSISDQLLAHSVTLAIEPLGPSEGNFLNLAAQGVELIRQIDCPNVKLHLDVKAMSSEPTGVGDIIRENRQELVHFHANDPNLLGPGMGEFDQRPVFQALQDIGYNDWVSVEVFDFALGYKEILKRSWHGMHSAIAAAG